MMSPRSANSCSKASAFGQDEQPWLVNSSITALGFCFNSSAAAGRASARAIVAAARTRRAGMCMFLGTRISEGESIWREIA
jgi:hypothetical protein